MCVFVCMASSVCSCVFVCVVECRSLSAKSPSALDGDGNLMSADDLLEKCRPLELPIHSDYDK